MLTIIVLGLPDFDLFKSNQNIFEERINHYKKYGKVLITKYKHIDSKYYEPFYSNNIDGVSLIEIEDEPVLTDTSTIHNYLPKNFPNQVNNTLKTLEQVKTPHVMKIRCNDYYENLQLLIDLFLTDTKKFISVNLGWSGIHPNFFNDHIFISETDVLNKTYYYINEFLKNKNSHFIEGVSTYSCEYILGKCFLEASFEKYPKVGDEFLFDRCDYIDIKDIGKFLFSCSSCENIIEWGYKYQRFTNDDVISNPQHPFNFGYIKDKKILKTLKI